jgi:hypothetical protein
VIKNTIETKTGNQMNTKYQINEAIIMSPILETIEHAELSALTLLQDSNKKLSFFLDNPFIPPSEKIRIKEQIEENQIHIRHLEVKVFDLNLIV